MAAPPTPQLFDFETTENFQKKYAFRQYTKNTDHMTGITACNAMKLTTRKRHHRQSLLSFVTDTNKHFFSMKYPISIAQKSSTVASCDN